MRTAFVLSLCALLAGCATLDVSEPGGCEARGVVEAGNTYQVRQIRELPQDQLNRSCRGALREGQYRAGCYRAYADGTADVYYRTGDRQAFEHELCHVKHGRKHTARYIEEVRTGHPCPYCFYGG